MAILVKLAQDVTLPTIGAAHDALCAAFLAGQDVDLDVDGLETGDLGVVQLILAARVEAEANHRHLRLTAPANPVLISLLARTGLYPQTHADIDFWFHGVIPA
ncbi:STAS domain-containing protein [Novosphingobium sp. KACC 22771]|uniref:STAS domain-containing protein n=1 Tax=Novosphingobium sp. KACC 22771 TaxID=3025670 RepID=UPI002365266A|nr:STAS domain-containing protein [Novosphingobium sp. KACC 22771]WDF71734.1 STAS domain-containing protein [Novosphingobium sp. KACC 22771]